MNIYTKDIKELRKIMISFTKTIYGRTMFTLSYALFFLLLMITLISFLLYKDTANHPLLMTGLAFLTLLTFILGSINYYKELRIYISQQK